MKHLLKYAILTATLIAVYLLVGLASWYLPDKQIRKAITQSVEMGDIGEDYPRAIVNKEMCRMDNCTDALILNQAYSSHIMSPIQSVLLVPSAGGEIRGVASLDSVVNGYNQPIQTYARYWHGSTFLMRFLLFGIGRYANIRLLFYYTTSLLLLFLLFLSWKQGLFNLSVALTLSFILLKGYVLQFSIQFFPVLTLATVGAILAITYRNHPQRLQTTLYILGSLTAFFDLLTVPLLTLGIPLLTYFSCNDRNTAGMDWPRLIKTIVLLAFIWFIGYAVTWSSKWLIATWLTGNNVFAEALSVVAYRVHGEIPYTSHYNLFDVLTANISKLPLSLLAAIAAVLFLPAVFFHKRNNVKNIAILLTIAIMPYVWYVVLSNHSLVHCWFTYRAQTISVAAFLTLIMNLTDWPMLLDKSSRITRKAIQWKSKRQ